MADIFICYSSQDRLIAQQFSTLFEQLGWSVFMDTHIQAGHVFHVEIERQLEQARAVTVLWSTASRESEYVLDEAEEARKRDIYIPALIENVQIPYGFRRRQTANLTNWDGDEQHHELQHVFLPALTALLNSKDKKIPPTKHRLKTTVTPPKTPRSSKPVLTPGKTFRDKLQNGNDAPEMVVIPSGKFQMGRPNYEKGADDEIPQHPVIIAKPFAMGIYPVTFDDYDRFSLDTGQTKPDDKSWGRKNRPVINVSWDDALLYCQWLSDQTGRSYRLPTEAEWEYAARAKTTGRYWWEGDIGNNKAVCDGCGSQWDNEQTAPVGSFKANPFGLYDVHGNVWEWCEDKWHKSYKDAPGDGSAWIDSPDSESRVLRGGSWLVTPDYCRSAFRLGRFPGSRGGGVGFRLCCSSPIE